MSCRRAACSQPRVIPPRWLAFTGSEARYAAVAGGFGIGAPPAAVVLEELVALGAREVISVGAARMPATALRLWGGGGVTAAIRDEGVSQHYAPAETFAWPSETFTSRLTQPLAAGRDR